MDAESLYIQLGQLVSDMPELGVGPITPEINRWLGRAHFLVGKAGIAVDQIVLSTASDGLGGTPLMREFHAQQIRGAIHRALAAAEAAAPTSARGGFVAVGAALDALQVVGRVLAEASKDAFIVDAYLDAKVFTDFGPSAGDGVGLRILTDSFYTKPDAVRPAMLRWRQQFGSRKTVEVRLSSPRALHDRLIVIDGYQTWSLTQSLKDFANRSPALVQKVDPDLAQMKREFYEQLWSASTPLA